MKILLQRGAGVNSKDKDNITALMEASIMDHRDVVKHLLKVKLQFMLPMLLHARVARQHLARPSLVKQALVQFTLCDGV